MPFAFYGSLEGLQVYDQLEDLGLGDVAVERRHDRRIAGFHLRAALQAGVGPLRR